MKLILTLILFQLVFVSPVFSQSANIDSITVKPSNPTATDTIMVYAHCTFPSTGCTLKSSAINQQSLIATATHCLGIASAFCSRTDTFVLLPRPAGTYNFRLSLYTAGIPNCDVSILGAEDSTNITISGATNTIQYLAENQSSVKAYYCQGRLHLSSLPTGIDNYNLELTSITGQRILQRIGQSASTPIIIELVPGVYLLTINKLNLRLVGKFVVE